MARKKKGNMPQFGKIGSLPTVLRAIVNHMLDDNKPETEIAEKITGIPNKSANPEIAGIDVLFPTQSCRRNSLQNQGRLRSIKVN
jgi:hypothetical protein